MPEVFVSYRRAVQPAVAALEAAGIRCFLDVHDISPLEPFPDRLRHAIANSMVLLAWWSADYTDSSHCMDEFRLAWQHARRHTSALYTRLWVLNPEALVDHICAGELDAQNFLRPPQPGHETTWAQSLAAQLHAQLAALKATGSLAQETHVLPAGCLAGVPHKSNHFTGRGAELMRIHSQLHPPKVGSQARAVAVQTHGMPGIGKTELATAYAHDFAHAYPGGVFWLSLAALDQAANLDEHQGQLAWLRAVDATLQYQPTLSGLLHDDQGQLLAPLQARQRLAGHSLPGPALWVLDNLPVFKRADLRDALLAFWRAPFFNAHTLATTRDSGDMAGFAPVPLGILATDDALRLLASYRDMGGAGEKEAAQAIVAQTGGHTQALVLLGEHIKTSTHGYTRLRDDMSAQGVVPRIEAVSQLLQDALGPRARGVLAAYAISLRSLSPHACQLLALAARCEGNSPFPAALLMDAAQMDSDAATAALRSLLQGALLTRRQGADSTLQWVEIHPLTALVCQVLLPPVQAQAGASPIVADGTADALHHALALQLVAVLRNARDIRQHAHVRLYVAQAQHMAMRLGNHPRAADLWSWMGRYHYESGHRRLALEAFGQALDVHQRVGGEEHPSTLASMSNLASTLKAMGDLAGARAMQQQVLEVRRRVLGEAHPDTLTSMNNLASTLFELGDWAGAQTMEQQVLELSQRVRGEEHPNTILAHNNLQTVLRVLHQSDRAG